jgi:hypothetical protein
VNIPLVAPLFAPFAFLPASYARPLFTTLGLWIVVAAYRAVVGLTGATGLRAALIAALFTINGPLMYSLQIGNTTHHVLWLLTIAAGRMRDGRDVGSGILVALSAVLKLPLALLGLWFGVERRLRAVVVFVLTMVAIGVLSLAVFGVEEHRRWYTGVMRPFSSRPMVAYNVQSIDGAVARQMTDADVGEWLPVDAGSGFLVVRSFLLVVLAASTAWVLLRAAPARSAGVLYLDLSILLCFAIVASPVSWTHYYLLLLLPLGLYVGDALAVPRTAPWRALIVLAVLLISPPVRPLLILDYLAHGFGPRALISHYLAGGLILLGVLLAARWRLSPEERA